MQANLKHRNILNCLLKCKQSCVFIMAKGGKPVISESFFFSKQICIDQALHGLPILLNRFSVQKKLQLYKYLSIIDPPNSKPYTPVIMCYYRSELIHSTAVSVTTVKDLESHPNHSFLIILSFSLYKEPSAMCQTDFKSLTCALLLSRNQ